MLANITIRENVFTHPSLLDIPSILEADSFTQSDIVKKTGPQLEEADQGTNNRYI